MQSISLNGVWEGHGLGPHGDPLVFEGAVPGCVHTDLERAGLIEDPFWRDNAQKCRWIENGSWQYVRRFDAPRIRGAELRFEGLDVYCDVYLNGRLLGRSEDMFVPCRFEVENCLKERDNELEVFFYSPVALTQGRPPRSAAFTAERLYTRREQCTYSWDWVDRFVTCGICGDVCLCWPDEAELEQVYLYTSHLDASGAQLQLQADFSAVCSDCFLELELTDPAGRPVASRLRRIVEPQLYESFDVPDPLLWFPNGSGTPNLYRMRLRVMRGDRVLDERTVRCGIRTLRLLQLPDEPGSPNYEKCLELKKGPHVSGENARWDRNDQFSGFTVLVNGVPVFCKGANWVPCEPFASAETREKTAELLRLAAAAGMNMVRIWGGGIFEHDFFYEECDRLGILVVQDFLMACGDYPDREEWFQKALGEEAGAAVLRLRNHPCLAWWAGDNENAVEADDNLARYPGRATVRGVIEPIVHRLDPMRAFLPSSPYNGVPYGSITCGTTHNTQFIGDKFNYIRYHELEDYQAFFAKFLARFSAEEPSMGAPMFCSLERFMTAEDIFGDDLSMWRFHTKNNPSEAFRTFELFDYLQVLAQKLLGPFAGGEDRVLKLQYVQYEWVRVTVELFRRSKGFSWGLLFWMLDDCWPASGWSLIDYYCVPKAAYYAFRRAAKGVAASLCAEGGSVCAYVCNDTPSPARGRGILRRVDLDTGEQRSWSFGYEVPANVSQPVFALPLQQAEMQGSNAVLVCDIGGDRALWFEKTPGALRLPDAKVTMERPDPQHLRLHADAYVHAVMLDGEYEFEDNCFCMLPDETRLISLRPSLGARSDRVELRILK